MALFQGKGARAWARATPPDGSQSGTRRPRAVAATGAGRCAAKQRRCPRPPARGEALEGEDRIVSIAMLERAAQEVDPCLDEVAFGGGAAIALWSTDEGAPEPRVTKDVDLVVEVA